jgi:exopolysaccharide production protein ExoZ
MKRPLVFTNVQIARLIAAVVVLLHHAVYQITQHRVPGVTSYTEYLHFDGSTGVDIFFVISGFIMIVTSADRFGSGANAATFLKRRLARIVPLYWIFTALMVVASIVFRNSVAHTDIAPAYLAASLFFIPMANTAGQIQPVLLLGWTLNYEMLFYGIFAAAMLLPKRVGIPVIFAAILSLAAMGTWVGAGTAVPILFWTRPIILEFLLGILVGLLILRRSAVAGGAAAALVVASFAALWVASAIEWTDTAWRCFAAGLPAAAIVAGAALGPQAGQDPLTRLLRLGGDASYALYLSHPFVINAMSILWRHIPVASGFAFLLATLVVALAVAVIIHLLVERPILDALHGRPIALMRHPLVMFVTGRQER